MSPELVNALADYYMASQNHRECHESLRRAVAEERARRDEWDTSLQMKCAAADRLLELAQLGA